MIGEFLEIHQVFHLSCPDRSELARRMRKRALKDNRMDDASERVIQQRIATYEAETKPILEFYSDSLVKEIDATRQPVEVAAEILNRIIALPVFKSFGVKSNL
jgi:adenylate kinase